ncbi:MAG: flagellar biosynthesis anti-sigma factor FlgM [Thermoleophilaceae bacterium]
MSVYDVCTDCGYLRIYSAALRAGVLDRCPVCAGELVRSPSVAAYPPVYVARTREVLAAVSPLGREQRPRRRGAVHERRGRARPGASARLAALASTIADGSYAVDARRVAEAMLSSPATRGALGLARLA